MTTDQKQILVSENDSYVLPKPPRGPRAQLVVDQEAATPPTARAVRGVGARVRVQAESLDVLFQELRTRLEGLDAAIAEDSRAQLKGAVRDVGDVLGWCEEVQKVLAVEGARAERGEEPIDLSELCEEVAAVRQEPSSPISVITRQPAICWGERARIVHLVKKALDLVWARTEQQGLRRLEISWREDAACVRVSSQGEPVDGVDPELVDAFRAAAGGADVTVEPDALGPAGAGMLLVLPRD